MYLGRIVEVGPATLVCERPLHPYTRALVGAVPVPDPNRENQRQRILLPGDPPSPMNPSAGCAFHPRCPHAVHRCRATIPVLEVLEADRQVACIRAREKL